MKNIKFIILLALLTMINVTCTDDFDEINTDPKNFTLAAVSSAEYPLFVKRALYTPNYMPFGEGRGPFQLLHSLFTDVYANYFATTAPNFDSDQFILVGRWLNGAYLWFYNRAAPNIQIAESTAADLGFTLENAMMKVWRVYSYQRMTDLWGPIPYSNYGNLQSDVPYDSQQDIYTDFFNTLDEAVAVFNSNAGETSFLGSNDVLFGGDVDSWKRFASTLRLRAAMRIRYADESKAKTEAEKAIADGVMLSNADNAIINTDINFRNMYNTITQWGEFRMSGDMESILKGYQDPRVQSYFDVAAQPDATDDPDGVSFPYEGFQNGQTKSDKQGIDFNALASDMAPAYTQAGAAGPNVVIMDAAEAYFLRAEGSILGWNMGDGSAQDQYEQGINLSLEQNGFGAENMSGEIYINSSGLPMAIDANTPAVSTVPVAFSTNGSFEEQLEQIITQKWIALYPNSEEAYAERRRTGYPILYDRVSSLNPNIPTADLPRRMTYVSSEYDNNRAAVEESVNNLLGGPDLGTTRLWWDKKQ